MGRPVCSTLPAFATGKSADAALRADQFRCGIMGLIGAKEASSFRGANAMS
jgi:hypothetical protein